MFQRSPFCRGSLVLLLTLIGENAAGAGPCTPPQTLQTKLRANANVATYTELGTWFGDHKQFGCASEAYREALKLEPNSARLPYLLGLSLYSEGRLDEAVAALQQSIEIAPAKLKPHLILAAALERLERKTEAKEQWQAALKIDPQSSEALQGMANALADGGDFAGAIALLRSGPKVDDIAIALAQVYVRLKMQDQAAKTLGEALAKNPASLPLASTLISVYMKQLHNQAAEKLCENTLRHHPSDPELQRLYLQVLILTGNTAVARPLAEKLLAKTPRDFELLYMNGILEHDAGEQKAAREHLEQAVAANPQVGAAHFHLGIVLAQLNEPTKARKELERALELGVSEPEAHFELGKVLHTLGQNDDSAQQLKLYQLALQAKNNRSLAASKTAQADKALGSGDARQALSFYREALDATPDDALLNFKLAVALDAVGDIANELTALQKAVRMNPDLASAQNQLGFLASRSGDTAAAEKYFREAVRAAPAFGEAWVNLAATLGLESRFSEARKAVDSALQLDPQDPQALLLRDTLAKALAKQ